ncbi:MAG: HsdR family type I site-specific deoxyribonuclease [Gemmatimonadetes bacterium]|nr:HsdR family type I site-specific deoxyribonuclease [Gemmatimonadota bacterium]MYD13678.1 HsdR family type I site-specific deoxyribonuclease [Gemmatimonadota bacterium]MYI66137.1 HsdR family type I site-specific deoxyribonuclease [Gemmatimonadota bacterium]
MRSAHAGRGGGTTAVGELEIKTQRRVVKLFRDRLGYEYLGDWRDREDNRNIETGLLERFLVRQGHPRALMTKAIRELEKAAALGGGRNLYEANREAYRLLRYPARIKPGVEKNTADVRLIDWKDPLANHFALAEEVTVAGGHTKRPDLVLYVNGIAIGVIELKRSTVSVAEGIRQNLSNQEPHFIRPFFTTVQLVMAGNESQGLRYGVIGTPEEHWRRWKEMDASSDGDDSPLLSELAHLCARERLLEVVHDFVAFDAGVKKVCRPNQYFGVKAAQGHVKRREGGIIWHTQGSGKSLTMVWLARWIRENVRHSRVLVITDRTELDDQIEEVFMGVGEAIHRTASGADLAEVLPDPEISLVCSLVQKFGASGEGDVDRYVRDLHSQMGAGFRPAGDIHVFVDECHRTQSGKLHRAMTKLLPEATLIGFTGTPLLKSDKRRSIETFGPYIHTYKYDEAIGDEVVLDLRYEARDIDQHLTSEAKIDQWFDLKTKGLSDLARAQLRRRWGTMRKVTSSRDRIGKIVADILIDMETKDRLKSGRGNAMLVCDSVYAACRFFRDFSETDLKGKCAIVTSYRPTPGDISGEETGAGVTEALLKHKVYRRMLADHFGESEDKAMHRAEEFEETVKGRFVNDPGQMKLLIVVDKLLTGFDAPPATYLYIDKKMRDHGLFQAICRVNRLDGEDKKYGCVIDYKDLFRSLEDAITDYTGEAFDGFDREDVKGLLSDRLEQGRTRLEETREAVRALCEPVEPPRDAAAFRRYFCHDDRGEGAEAVKQLAANERKRLDLYRMVAAFVRAYADLANEMLEAGYTEAERLAIRDEVAHFENVRREIKLASGDAVDLKALEPAMRHLLDSYIRADDSRVLSEFEDMTLVDLIVARGEDAVEALPGGMNGDRRAVAETIENNVRRLIVDEMVVNPKYYERMSKLLDELIRQRREGVIGYEDYLKRVTVLTRQVKRGGGGPSRPPGIDSPALRAIYDNLPETADADSETDLRESVALAVDRAVRDARWAGWRGHPIKERHVKRAIHTALGPWKARTEEIFDIVTAQRGY